MQTTRLSNKHLHTLEHIFQHPTTHTLEWHDVNALIAHMGTVKEGEKGQLTFTLKGASQAFHRSEEKEVSAVSQVLELRRFLEEAGIGKDGPVATEAFGIDTKLRLLVVINQEETLLFRSEDKNAVPEQLYPYDPHGALHHLNHLKGADKGSRMPENLTYYKEIARALVGAEEVLFIGNGTGASSAMSHLTDFLTTHHPEIAEKIVGTLTLDLEALTEGRLLQQARAFFMHRDGLGLRNSMDSGPSIMPNIYKET